LRALLHDPWLDQAARALDRQCGWNVDTRFGEGPIGLLNIAAVVLAQGNDPGCSLLAELDAFGLLFTIAYGSQRRLQSLIELGSFVREETDEHPMGRCSGGRMF
jgi:hypothetical protein